jgi:hypothetical protein
VLQGLSFDTYDDRKQETVKLREELNMLALSLKQKEFQLDSMVQKGYIGKELLDEIRNVYPQILSCTYAESFQFKDTLSVPVQSAIVVFSLDKGGLSNDEKEKVNKWVQTRLHAGNVKVIYE